MALSGNTCCPGYQSTSSPWTQTDYLEVNQPVLNMPIKTGCLQDLGHRVGNITAGQAGNTSRQDIKGNRQGGYSNRQAGKCVGQASNTYGLSVMESAVIKEGWRTECIIWIYNSDGYNWQCLDRLFCFLQINLGFSVEIQVGQIYYLAFVFSKHCFDLIDKMGPKRKRRKNLKKTHLQGLSGEIQLLTYRAGRRENRGREGGGGRETTEGGDKGIKPGGQKPQSQPDERTHYGKLTQSQV